VKKCIMILLAGLTLFMLAGCVPQYESTEISDGIVKINGITYKGTEDTIWRPVNMNRRKLVGELVYPNLENPSFLFDIYTFKDDVHQMFIALKYKKQHLFLDDTTIGPDESYGLRDDIALPTMDSNGVDTIGIRREYESKFFNVVQDKETIDQLFDVMSRAETQDEEGYQYVYVLELTNSDFPGIEIQVNVCRQGDEYWLYFNEIDNYNIESGDVCYYYQAVQIPRELLEKIAGKAVPTGPAPRSAF